MVVQLVYGINARTAARIVQFCYRYDRESFLAHTDHPERSTTTRSIMGLLCLEAAKHTALTIRVEGEDNEVAFVARGLHHVLADSPDSWIHSTDSRDPEGR